MSTYQQINKKHKQKQKQKRNSKEMSIKLQT
jgi:hypothetical protein